MLPEEIYYKFTSPENEATVKLYTDGSKESLGIEPKLSYPKTSLGSHYPMKNILTQFNLHSQNNFNNLNFCLFNINFQ